MNQSVLGLPTEEERQFTFDADLIDKARRGGEDAVIQDRRYREMQPGPERAAFWKAVIRATLSR